MASVASNLKAALAALKQEQVKTQRAITTIEGLLREIGEEAPASALPSSFSLQFTPKPDMAIDVRPPSLGLRFNDMTIGDAAVAYLRAAKRPQKIKVIIRALVDGGLQSKSKNMYRMIYNILASRLDKDVAKFGSEWGLKEWEVETK